MTFNFAKKMFLGSVIAMGAFGLVACGDDSSSGSDGGNDQKPIQIPTQQDAIIKVDGLESRVSGDDIKFKGSFNLDFTDTTSQNSDALAFIGIEYKVAKGADASNLVAVAVPVVSNPITFPLAGGIDLGSINSAGVSINLLDPAFANECGTYSLIVTVSANDGTKDFSTTQVIPFEREAAEYCKEAPVDTLPAEPTGIPMVTCQVDVSTNIAPGLNLTTCTAVPAAEAATADIVFSKVGNRNSEITAKSGNGTILTRITNGDVPPYADDYEVGFWPEVTNNRDAFVSDFKFNKNATDSEITEMIENSNQIYVAKTAAYNEATGAGFFAFAIVNNVEGNNGDQTLTIKVYKVQ